MTRAKFLGNRSGRPTVAALLVGVALGAAACGSSGGGSASAGSTTVPPGTAPPTTSGPVTTAPATTAPPTTSSATTGTTVVTATLPVRVYLAHGDVLGVVGRAVPATGAPATAALNQLLAGPTAAERSAGFATAVPAGTRLLGVSIASGTATVNLSGEFESGGGSLSVTERLAEVVYTVTQFPTVSQVVFQLDGRPVTVFSGEGLVLDHPATRASFESVTPPILVETPVPGAVVGSRLRTTGTANVYEATFQAQVVDATGRTLVSATVHATSGTGTRGTFDTTLNLPAGLIGTGTLTVYDLSPRDGSRQDVVTVPVRFGAR